MNKPAKKTFVIVAISVLMVVFFYFDLYAWLTLEQLKAGSIQLSQWYSDSPLFVLGAFFIIYILVTALSLPGAVVMTLAAGALFGLVIGTALVSFASSIGATLAFLASRYVLRDSVQNKFSKRLAAINKGIEKEGAFYLFTLRLVPIFPFFIINLVMGLTSIKAKTFYWVSQVGMLAGTIVYVNAGTQLAKVESLSGILSPALLLSFILLGVFPLITKKIITYVKAQRVYKGYKKPKRFDKNLIVIGAGSGGLVSAYIAAAVKAKVTLIEANKMGGDCLNYGCVPSKALIRSAKLAHQIKHASHYGLQSATPTFSFKEVMQRVHNIIATIEPHDSVERYTDLGVDVEQGHGRLIDPWTVEVTNEAGAVKKLTARNIILATGAEPIIPALDNLTEDDYVTSDTLWDKYAKLNDAPKRLIVLGGGPIGCELSQAFARLGSQVTQVERGANILSREDSDVALFTRQKLSDDGVTVLTHHVAVGIERKDKEKFLIVENEGRKESIVFDSIIFAVGRRPRLQGYGLENLSIETHGTIITNEFLQTQFPNIYAVGDVAGPYQFTHTASHQAWFAAVNSLFGQFKKFKADYRVIPWTTFVDPEIARVGLNEKEAKQKGIAYEVTRYDLSDLDRAITDGAAQGFIKILTKPNKDSILGVTIVGEHGGELMAEFVLAMKYNLGLNKILATIHTYPTWAEANKYTAGEWKRAHAPEKILKWVERYHHWRR